MELQIKRKTKEGKKLLGGAKFEYHLEVQLRASEDEKSLWDKYSYSDQLFYVSGDLETFKVRIFGRDNISFSELLNGYTWKAEELLVVFTHIPDIIGQQLRSRHAELLLRECWHGEDEVWDLTEEEESLQSR